MILLKRTDRSSIYLIFDSAGALALMRAFGPERTRVELLVDRRLWGGRKGRRGGLEEAWFCVVTSPGLDLLRLEDDSVTLELDEDTIEHVSERLMVAVPGGFSPAEIAEVSHAGADREMSIYGVLDETISKS